MNNYIIHLNDPLSKLPLYILPIRNTFVNILCCRIAKQSRKKSGLKQSISLKESGAKPSLRSGTPLLGQACMV